ncbi:MAG TPA: S26 family signal peptidase [Candidatus Polarisedimenticolaceae bacterium]
MTARRLAAPLAAALVVAVGGVAACVHGVARPFAIAGPSMQPTLFEGDRVVVDLWTYGGRAPRRGELVLVELADGRSLVKRIASDEIPGEHFGESLFEVLGDNAAASDDSRRFGPVPRERIRGRVVLRYWPPSRAGAIR